MGGEAKRRRQRREAALVACKPLSTARFNHYAIGTRLSPVQYLCEEFSYWASHDERLVGLVGRDTTDDDYLWMMLARDQNGCFRCANLRTDFPSAPRAEEALLEEIKQVVDAGEVDAYGVQGDETNAPLDLLRMPTDGCAERPWVGMISQLTTAFCVVLPSDICQSLPRIPFPSSISSNCTTKHPPTGKVSIYLPVSA